MHDYMYQGEPLVVVGWLKMLLVWQVGFPRLKFTLFDFGIGQE